MTHFRPSMIATLVTSALAVGSIGAASASQFKSITTDKQVLAAAAAQVAHSAAAVVNQPTVSGMKNTYDAKLNAATFVWQGVGANALPRPEMISVAPEHRNTFAANHYLNLLTGQSVNKTMGSHAQLRYVHDIQRGGIIAKYKQEVNNVEVFNREYSVMMDRDHNLVAGSGYFSKSSLPADILNPNAFANPQKAIETAYSDLVGKRGTVTLSKVKTANKYTSFKAANNDAARQIVGEPRAKNVYFEHKGRLVAAHYVEVQVGSVDTPDSDYYSYVVEAKTQRVLFKNNLKAHSGDAVSYRVWADVEAPNRPWDGPHGNVNPAPLDSTDATAILDAPLVTLAHGPISTHDQWLPEGATETRGNNVDAYADVLAPDGFTTGDVIAQTTSANTFDYQLTDDEPEHSLLNRKAAIVNMFYMNNYLHDEFYDHGFDEVSGNAQLSNYGRGGEEGDVLRAEAQDNSGTNNANMSTPADGASPRMQMFLWQQPAPNFANIISHPELTDIAVAQASFGPGNFDITGQVVRYVDATDPAGDGCEGAVNAGALAGKIALIDRGACAFVVKVVNAQAAGAVGVMVANNVGGDAVFGMGGADDSITIGSVMISQNAGAALQALLDNGETVEANIKSIASVPFKDSSFDNAIVAHEWGHYISNRLVGNASGLSNNQGGSMGEGWGDFHALLTVSAEEERNIAGNALFEMPYAAITYVRSFSRGIRLYPYTTNMEINQHTFKNIEDNAEVHASGNVWTTMLWDAYVGLKNKEGHTYATARSAMMDYLVAGYKMTPNAPTFTEARDAILAAAYAADITDYDVILAAFARRGMGLGAISPPRDSNDHIGVVESFGVTHDQFATTGSNLDVNYSHMGVGYCSNDSILDKGETGTVSFTISNLGSEVYTNITGKVEVVSGHDVTLANDGIVTFGDLGVTGHLTSAPIEFTLNDAGTADDLRLKLTFPDFGEVTQGQEVMISTIVNYDFQNLPFVPGLQHSDAETLAIENDFKEHVMVGGDAAKGTGGLSHDFASLWRELGVDMGEGSLFIRNNGFNSDIAYETRPFVVSLTNDLQIGWAHYYNFEQDFDGGVVEVSINGSEWFDVLEAGGTFLGNGYDGQSQTILEGRDLFTGEGAAFEAVSFGNALRGQTIQFRFRAVTDGGASAVGWVIDDIDIIGVDSGMFSEVIPGDTNACDNRLPFVTTISEEQTVSEGTSVSVAVEAGDADTDTLTYSWTQVSGPEVTLTGADTATATFTAPDVATAGDAVELMVHVMDGSGMAMASTKVNITDVPVVVTPPPPTVKRSGGGSTGLIALLLLPLAFIRRRVSK